MTKEPFDALCQKKGQSVVQDTESLNSNVIISRQINLCDTRRRMGTGLFWKDLKMKTHRLQLVEQKKMHVLGLTAIGRKIIHGHEERTFKIRK